MSTAAAAIDEGSVLLSARNLSKAFGDFQVVDDVSFDIASGTITGLIGPNGAGKTTLFNLLCGFLKADSGTVQLAGKPISGVPPERVFAAGLARTFQIPRPFPEMTVLENVMLVPDGQIGERYWNNWLRPRQVRAQEERLRERAAEVIGFCNLQPVIGELAGRLSGGQLKLLELARVLAADPRLITLDEPAAGVNPALMETLIDRIEALNRRGITFLIIEHDMDMVMSVCEPLMVMAAGKLIFIGPRAAAREDPAVLDAYLGGQP